MGASACDLGQGVSLWLAAILTLAVLSYLLGENVIFRAAEHLLVGVTAGYAAGVAWSRVLWPRFLLLWGQPGEYWYYAIFFALGLLMLLRAFDELSFLADLPLAIIFGVGAGLILTGALGGTLAPQIRAAIVSLAPADYGGGWRGWAYVLDALLMLVCTLSVLGMFHFGRREAAGALRAVDTVGRLVLAVVFGALFAVAVTTFFGLLRGRLVFLLRDWLQLIPKGS